MSDSFNRCTSLVNTISSQYNLTSIVTPRMGRLYNNECIDLGRIKLKKTFPFIELFYCTFLPILDSDRMFEDD